MHKDIHVARSANTSLGKILRTVELLCYAKVSRLDDRMTFAQKYVGWLDVPMYDMDAV